MSGRRSGEPQSAGMPCIRSACYLQRASLNNPLIGRPTFDFTGFTQITDRQVSESCAGHCCCAHGCGRSTQHIKISLDYTDRRHRHHIILKRTHIYLRMRVLGASAPSGLNITADTHKTGTACIKVLYVLAAAVQQF